MPTISHSFALHAPNSPLISQQSTIPSPVKSSHLLRRPAPPPPLIPSTPPQAFEAEMRQAYGDGTQPPIDFVAAAQRFASARKSQHRVQVGMAPFRAVGVAVATVGRVLRATLSYVGIGIFVLTSPVHIWLLPLTWPVWVLAFGYIGGESSVEATPAKRQRRWGR